jgi:hypothetical protein
MKEPSTVSASDEEPPMREVLRLIVEKDGVNAALCHRPESLAIVGLFVTLMHRS